MDPDAGQDEIEHHINTALHQISKTLKIYELYRTYYSKQIG